MKKVLIALILVLTAIFVFASCTKEVDTGNPESIEDTKPEGKDIDPKDELAGIYFALDKTGYTDFLEAFPTEWKNGVLTEEFENSKEEYDAAYIGDSETRQYFILSKYGETYDITYEMTNEENLTGDEYALYESDLHEYSYITSTVASIVRRTYNVTKTGLVDNEPVKNNYLKDVIFIYTAGEGWKVSPQSFLSASEE